MCLSSSETHGYSLHKLLIYDYSLGHDEINYSDLPDIEVNMICSSVNIRGSPFFVCLFSMKDDISHISFYVCMLFIFHFGSSLKHTQ